MNLWVILLMMSWEGKRQSFPCESKQGELHDPAAVSPGEQPPVATETEPVQSRSGCFGEEKNLPLPGIEPRIIHLPSHCTDEAILPLTWKGRLKYPSWLYEDGILLFH